MEIRKKQFACDLLMHTGLITILIQESGKMLKLIIAHTSTCDVVVNLCPCCSDVRG